MIIAAKLVVGLLSVGLGLWLSANATVQSLSDRRFRWLVWAIWIVSRGGLFIGLYGILGQIPTSDVISYYYPQGLHALHGDVVYRDFTSSYAPLFPYAIAAGLSLWSSPTMVVLMAIAAEAVSLVFWTSSVSRLLGPRESRRAVLYYVTSALPLMSVAVEGQNQVWVAFFLSIAVWLVAFGRPVLAAVTVGLPFLAVKLLALLAAPAFLFNGARRPLRGLAFAAAPVTLYGGLALAGVDVFMPLRLEGTDQSSGNLPFLTGIVWGGLGGSVSPAAVDLFALALLGGVTLWLSTRRAASTPVSTVWSLVIIFAMFMLVSRKSYSSYLVMAFFPVCMVAASSTSAWFSPAAFGLFGLASMIERTLWFRWLNASRSVNTLAQLQAAGPLRAIAFLAAEAVLIATYVRLCQEAYVLLTRGQTVPESTPDIEASRAVYAQR